MILIVAGAGAGAGAGGACGGGGECGCISCRYLNFPSNLVSSRKLFKT